MQKSQNTFSLDCKPSSMSYAIPHKLVCFPFSFGRIFSEQTSRSNISFIVFCCYISWWNFCWENSDIFSIFPANRESRCRGVWWVRWWWISSKKSQFHKIFPQMFVRSFTSFLLWSMSGKTPHLWGTCSVGVYSGHPLYPYLFWVSCK